MVLFPGRSPHSRFAAHQPISRDPIGVVCSSRGCLTPGTRRTPIFHDPGGVGQRYAVGMASTFTRVLLHIVFSTKGRRDLITPEAEQHLYGYIGGVCRGNFSTMLTAGGTANHAHLLVSFGKTVAIADLLLQIKRDSSAWIKRDGHASSEFRWQEGYGAFSIGESGVEPLRRYIATQKEHHRTITFEDEMRSLLRKYNVEFDERYVWD